MSLCPDCGHKNIAGESTCDSCGASLEHLSLPQTKGELSKKIVDATIADLNPRAAIIVEGAVPVSDAIQLMRDGNMGCVLVVKKGEIQGILTERDLLYAAADGRKLHSMSVSTLMHKGPVCLKSDDSISVAFHHMSVGGYRHLPIHMPKGRIGMISARDLLRHLST